MPGRRGSTLSYPRQLTVTITLGSSSRRTTNTKHNQYNKPYKIHNIPVPTASGPYDLLVKTAVASLCHTDGMVTAGTFGTALPCTASHEGAGTVAAVGSAVQDFKPGDRVMCGLFRNMCGRCGDCAGAAKAHSEGREDSFGQYCGENDGAIGVHTQGAFAEYVVCDARQTARLPDAVSFGTAAPLACAGCTAWRGVLRSRCDKGEWMGIVGAGGGLGHLAIQFARALGIKTVGVDARDEGLALAKEAGCDVLLDARKGDKAIMDEIRKITGEEGVKATVNVSDAKFAAATACAMTRKHGLLVQIAQPDNVEIPFAELIFRDIRIEGSLICSADEARRMLDVVAEHGISVKTNPFNGLHEIPKLVELAHGGKMQGKAVVIVDQQQVEDERKAGVKLV